MHLDSALAGSGFDQEGFPYDVRAWVQDTADVGTMVRAELCLGPSVLTWKQCHALLLNSHRPKGDDTHLTAFSTSFPTNTKKQGS